MFSTLVHGPPLVLCKHRKLRRLEGPGGLLCRLSKAQCPSLFSPASVPAVLLETLMFLSFSWSRPRETAFFAGGRKLLPHPAPSTRAVPIPAVHLWGSRQACAPGPQKLCHCRPCL